MNSTSYITYISQPGPILSNRLSSLTGRSTLQRAIAVVPEKDIEAYLSQEMNVPIRLNGVRPAIFSSEGKVYATVHELRRFMHDSRLLTLEYSLNLFFVDCQQQKKLTNEQTARLGAVLTGESLIPFVVTSQTAETAEAYARDIYQQQAAVGREFTLGYSSAFESYSQNPSLEALLSLYGQFSLLSRKYIVAINESLKGTKDWKPPVWTRKKVVTQNDSFDVSVMSVTPALAQEYKTVFDFQRKAQDLFIHLHEHIATKHANQYELLRSGHWDDYFSRGKEGLWHASRYYDYTQSCFYTYAWWWSRAMVTRYFSKMGSVPFSNHAHECLIQINALEREAFKHGKRLTFEEIISSIVEGGKYNRNIVKSILYARSINIISLDTPTYPENSKPSGLTLNHSVISDHVPLQDERVDNRIMLKRVMSCLDQLLPRERYAVEHYLFYEENFEDIATYFGFSQQAANKLYHKAIAKLRVLATSTPNKNSTP